MKHKEKQLEYARQYQTMSAKEWWKVVFSDKKKFNLDNIDGFQKYWHAKIFLKRITQQGIVEEDHLWFEEPSHHQENVNYNLSADYVKMLNDLSLAQERRRLCGEEWIFQQDNVRIHNATITKKYLFEQKIRFLYYPACSLDLNPIEYLWGLIVAKVYEGGRQCTTISKLKNAILDAWQKIPTVQLQKLVDALPNFWGYQS